MNQITRADQQPALGFAPGVPLVVSACADGTRVDVPDATDFPVPSHTRVRARVRVNRKIWSTRRTRRGTT